MISRLLQRVGVVRGVSILMYHGVWSGPLPFANWCIVAATDFRKQMAYLRRHVDVIPLSSLDGYRSGRRPAAAITFDDGYRNNRLVALPILQEFDLPATVFLATGLMNTHDTVWDARLYLALGSTSRTKLEWEGVRYAWRDARGRASAFRALKAVLKIHPQDQLQQRVRDIAIRLAQDPDAPVPESSPVSMLDSGDIQAMIASGLIDFGAHTHRHCILSRLDPAGQREEIGCSIRETARLAGRPCTLFAYPNGTAADYDSTSVRILADEGIRNAVTTIEAPNLPGTPALELRRYGIGAGLSMARFELKVHHLEHLLRRIRPQK